MKMHINKKQVINLEFFVILCVVWFMIGWTVRERLFASQAGPEITLVEQDHERILTDYPDKSLTNRELTYAAIRGMLRHIEDPREALFEPTMSQRFGDDFAGRPA